MYALSPANRLLLYAALQGESATTAPAASRFNMDLMEEKKPPLQVRVHFCLQHVGTIWVNPTT